MADFSHLGVVCEEWIDLTRSNPPPPTPGVLQDDSQTRELQKKINLQRLNACQKELNIIKDCAINIRTVAIPTIDLHEIDARVYYPPLTASKRITKKTENAEKTPVLLYFHGGGFFSGTLLSEDATCIRLACASGFTIVNVNYRHTPDWTSPTQFNDAWDARCWVLENHMELGIPALELYVAGTSTGACLAAGLVVKERLVSTKLGIVSTWRGGRRHFHMY
jgi:acetyl esterase/lipase